jgi:hypothetical protein
MRALPDFQPQGPWIFRKSGAIVRDTASISASKIMQNCRFLESHAPANRNTVSNCETTQIQLWHSPIALFLRQTLFDSVSN